MFIKNILMLATTLSIGIQNQNVFAEANKDFTSVSFTCDPIQWALKKIYITGLVTGPIFPNGSSQNSVNGNISLKAYGQQNEVLLLNGILLKEELYQNFYSRELTHVPARTFLHGLSTNGLEVNASFYFDSQSESHIEIGNSYTALVCAVTPSPPSPPPKPCRNPCR